MLSSHSPPENIKLQVYKVLICRETWFCRGPEIGEPGLVRESLTEEMTIEDDGWSDQNMKGWGILYSQGLRIHFIITSFSALTFYNLLLSLSDHNENTLGWQFFRTIFPFSDKTDLISPLIYSFTFESKYNYVPFFSLCAGKYKIMKTSTLQYNLLV